MRKMLDFRMLVDVLETQHSAAFTSLCFLQITPLSITACTCMRCKPVSLLSHQCLHVMVLEQAAANILLDFTTCCARLGKDLRNYKAKLRHH